MLRPRPSRAALWSIIEKWLGIRFSPRRFFSSGGRRAPRTGRRGPCPSGCGLITKHFPDAQIQGGHREGDEDEQRYEVELKKDGRHISTDVTADVGVVEIDEELRQDQVPEKVMKSFRRAFPKGEIKRSEKSADIRVTYHIEVTTDGRKREVTLSPRGKILEIEKRD